MTLIQRVAGYFLDHPDQWIDGRDLAAIGGAYAWRSRVSDIRRPPYNLDIQNRQRRVTTPQGESYVVSEYRFRADSTRNAVSEGGHPKVPQTSVGALTCGGL